LKVHYRVHNSLGLVYPVRALPPNFVNIHFSIILPCTCVCVLVFFFSHGWIKSFVRISNVFLRAKCPTYN
jgi:hypothetical protein